MNRRIMTSTGWRLRHQHGQKLDLHVWQTSFLTGVASQESKKQNSRKQEFCRLSNESGQTWTDIILSDSCLKTEFLGVCQWQVKSRPLTIFPAPRLSAKASFFGHCLHHICLLTIFVLTIPFSIGLTYDVGVHCVYRDMLLLTCSPDTFSPLLIFYSIVFAIVGDTFGKFICIRIFLQRTNSAGRKQSNCSNHRHLAANQTGCLGLGLNLRHLVSIGRRTRFFVGFLAGTGMTSTWGWNDLLDPAAMCFHEPEAAVDGNGGMMSILVGSGLLRPNFNTNRTGKHWLI